jgi:hypothetical protein
MQINSLNTILDASSGTIASRLLFGQGMNIFMTFAQFVENRAQVKALQ